MASRRLTREERATAPGHRPACVYCRKAFTPTHGRQIFCKPSCEREDYKARRRMARMLVRVERLSAGEFDRRCVECEQLFRPRPAPRPAQTCSDDCRKAALKRKRQVQFTALERRKSLTLTCEWCREGFLPGCGGVLPRYCSQKCRSAFSTSERAKRHQLKREARLASPPTCRYCAETFTPKAMGRPPLYCSSSCKWSFSRKSRMGMRPPREIEPADVQPVLMQDRLCGNCAHWAGGSRGCVLEVFRACQPGVLAQHWAARD